MTQEMDSVTERRQKRQRKIAAILVCLGVTLAGTVYLQPMSRSQQIPLASSPRDEAQAIATTLISSLKIEIDESLISALKEQTVQQKAELEKLTQELKAKDVLISKLECELDESKMARVPAEAYVTGSLEGKAQKHMVVKGDTLSGISQHYYGTAKRWNDIYQANKESIPNVNHIKTGTVLIIP